MLLLDTLPSATIFSNALSTQNYPSDLASPTYKTLSLLAPDSGLCFAPAHLYLVPAHTDAPVPQKAQEALQTLTISAQKAAAASLQGSVLAGGGSETDEYGDVAFWLDHQSSKDAFAGSNRAEAVLEALGLKRWLEAGAKIVSESQLAPGLDANLAPSPALEELKKVLGALEEPFAFRVQGGPRGGSTVLFLLVGRFSGGGWAGLLGIGVWSDA
ncbi:hypothetical protein EXIGLDRAFT_736757 [Exidia glandulosa HHB12029]|uniref:Uncharacterized protein n=1 Tax=Exidia glandulosa HHB12029 TaxID=1314781 RepID=A0A165PDV3_EXIGL|nr:hypothetical protein EXIGLDRAFT_736757 [Exidia glandulosa HHB12029]